MSEPSPGEQVRHFARRALEVLGVASGPQLRKPFGNGGAETALPDLLDEGEAVEVAVE